jgi:hypothetical protein
MRRAKLLGLVLVGVLVGWFASLGAELQEGPSGRRLTAIQVGSATTPAASFLQDSKTAACWLMIRARGDMSMVLAPAPREACER